jgi:class 3 adenylate cyclase
MAPRIQYAKTSDGVSLAYWKLGQGGTPLLVTPPLGVSNISLEWQLPELRAWYERLSARRMLVRYDPRGNGMSDRAQLYLSLEAGYADLSCIVRQVAESPIDILASAFGGALAVQFAAREPDRVRRLVLWSAQVTQYGPRAWERIDAIVALAERDWDLAVETFAHASIGWARGTEAHEWAALIKASIKQEDFVRGWRAFREFPGVASLLSDVRSPTLVLDSESTQAIPRGDARLLAAGIPGAQLLQLGTETPFQNEQGTRAVDEFLSDGRESFVTTKADIPPGTVIILFADIADSTALTERLGDAAFRAKARDLDAALRTVIREHVGTPIEGKLLGDGVLAVFTSARKAIEASLACGAAGASAGLPLHLGLHAGDVIREDNNVYGGAVNIASRISGLSAPGEVLVSETVRSLARTAAGVRFEDCGEQSLKGVGEPVRVWAVRQRGA